MENLTISAEQLVGITIAFTRFFYKHHFFKQHLAKLTIKQRTSKTLCKNKCVCFNRSIWLIWLIVMRTKQTMKNWSHRYHINRPRPTHGHKYSKYKIYHGKMMAVCIEHHLFNIWSSIHEKVKKRAEKSVANIKKRVYGRFVAMNGNCQKSVNLIFFWHFSKNRSHKHTQPQNKIDGNMT